MSRARLAVVAGGAQGGGLAAATEFCARSHTAVFQLNNEAGSVTENTRVRLVRKEEDLQVVAGAVHVGDVTSSNAQALLGCLAIGFEFAGAVDAVDPELGTARIVVAGQKVRAA